MMESWKVKYVDLDLFEKTSLVTSVTVDSNKAIVTRQISCLSNCFPVDC